LRVYVKKKRGEKAWYLLSGLKRGRRRRRRKRNTFLLRRKRMRRQTEMELSCHWDGIGVCADAGGGWGSNQTDAAARRFCSRWRQFFWAAQKREGKRNYI
jgi:hypothetical protein